MYRMSGQAHMYVHVGMESEAKANARRPMQKVVGIDCAVNDICAVEQRAQRGGQLLPLLLLLLLPLLLLLLLLHIPPSFHIAQILLITPAPWQRGPSSGQAFHERLPKMLRQADSEALPMEPDLAGHVAGLGFPTWIVPPRQKSMLCLTADIFGLGACSWSPPPLLGGPPPRTSPPPH